MSTKMERFGQTTMEEMDKKRLNSLSEKTQKANKTSVRCFRDYLVEKKQDAYFETFSISRLDECLQHFYLDARKNDGSHYKRLEAIRHGINRYLRSPPHNKQFDIIKDSGFRMSNSSFKAAMAEVKQMGKGSVEHYMAIGEDDRHKLYTSIQLNPNTPAGLFNKVQFDIRLYFCREGAENMHTMTKLTFRVKTDSKTGLQYVEKAMYELTKNHRESDKEKTSGVMPESPGSCSCPVASFERYISKLNPQCDRLWQRPKESFTDDEPWYCNSPVGEKKLEAFLSDLSSSCGLSEIYTNHSIRATGATILSKSSFGAAQIMSVTGHKSVQSLSVYQKIDTEEKVMMGKSIAASLGPSSVPSLPPPPSATSSPPSTSATSSPPSCVYRNCWPGTKANSSDTK